MRLCPPTPCERLGLAQEQLLRVPSLELPADEQIERRRLAAYEATQLFLNRALHARRGLTVGAAGAALIAQICRRLDGIPLAIELAAAWVGSLELAEIAGRLDDRFRFLTNPDPHAPPRHRTLRAAIEWSYNLLTPPQRLLFARLGVFAGGWDGEAALAICTDGWGEPLSPAQLPALLAGLAAKSLVQVEQHARGTRYRILETIRTFALEELAGDGEANRLADRHAGYFLAVAQKTASQGQLEWIHQIDAEQDNLRAALGRVAAGQGTLLVTGLRAVAVLADYWDVRSHFSEGRTWAETLLRAGDHAPADVATAELVLLRVGAGCVAGRLAIQQGELSAAEVLLNEALRDTEAAGELAGIAEARMWLGMVRGYQGHLDEQELLQSQALDEAYAAEEELSILRGLALLGGYLASLGRTQDALELQKHAYALAVELGDLFAQAGVLNGLGYALMADSRHEPAGVYFERCLELARRLENPVGCSDALNNLGCIAYYQGNHHRAGELFTESAAFERAIGRRLQLAQRLANLAEIALLQGEQATAVSYLREALEVNLALGNERQTAGCLWELAKLAPPLEAVMLLVAARNLYEARGAKIVPHEVEEYTTMLAAARARLAPADYASALERGQRMSSAQAVALAQALFNDKAS